MNITLLHQAWTAQRAGVPLDAVRKEAAKEIASIGVLIALSVKR